MSRAAIAIAIGLLAVVIACKDPPARLDLGPLVAAAEAPADLATFGAGAIELTPAIRPPTSDDGRLRIIGLLALPAGSQLDVTLRDGVPSIIVPEGTRVSRVEAVGDENAAHASWHVLDVRETFFEAASTQRFRLLRPARNGALAGLAWPRSDDGARQANAAIGTLFDADVLDGPRAPEARRDAAARLVRLNDCASCHGAWRPEDRSMGALVQRGTDGQGLYLLSAVFSDDGPFERYRPRNASRHDPFTEVRCGDREVDRQTLVCPDGRRPSGRLDVRAGRAAGDPHVARVCASRPRARVAHVTREPSAARPEPGAMQRAPAVTWRAAALAGAILSAACASSAEPAPEPAAPGTLDDARIESAAAAYRGFTKINAAPFVTQQHAGNPRVNVYANALAESSYRTIRPGGVAPAGFRFPPGSMLVKEMLETDGSASVLTVMYKKEAGYDSAQGDWWYGRLSPDGVPTNPAFAGRVDFCVSCHAGSAKWDHAWGVP